MKRILSLILCAMLLIALPVTCFAEIDLSGMSYEELVALKDQINLAMWECQEWQEVEVPQGVWQVGVDIPVGHWTITATPDTYTTIHVGSKLDATGKDVEESDYGKAMIKSPDRSSFNPNEDIESTDFELVEGAYVVIDGGIVIFTPYQGKPSLGFNTAFTSNKSSSSEETSTTEDENAQDELATQPEAPKNNASSGTEAITMGQKNALKAAKNYLTFMGFSYDGLINQLEYEGYSHEDAVYAADNCGADWFEQAAKSAKNYLSFMAFSRDGLIQQLEFEGFTYEQAVYAAEANGY